MSCGHVESDTRGAMGRRHSAARGRPRDQDGSPPATPRAEKTVTHCKRTASAPHGPERFSQLVFVALVRHFNPHLSRRIQARGNVHGEREQGGCVSREAVCACACVRVVAAAGVAGGAPHTRHHHKLVIRDRAVAIVVDCLHHIQQLPLGHVYTQGTHDLMPPHATACHRHDTKWGTVGDLQVRVRAQARGTAGRGVTHCPRIPLQ